MKYNYYSYNCYTFKFLHAFFICNHSLFYMLFKIHVRQPESEMAANSLSVAMASIVAFRQRRVSLDQLINKIWIWKVSFSLDRVIFQGNLKYQDVDLLFNCSVVMVMDLVILISLTINLLFNCSVVMVMDLVILISLTINLLFNCSVVMVMDLVILISLTINIFFCSTKIFYQATYQRIK